MWVPWIDVGFLFKTACEQPVLGPGVWCDWGINNNCQSCNLIWFPKHNDITIFNTPQKKDIKQLWNNISPREFDWNIRFQTSSSWMTDILGPLIKKWLFLTATTFSTVRAHWTAYHGKILHHTGRLVQMCWYVIFIKMEYQLFFTLALNSL